MIKIRKSLIPALVAAASCNLMAVESYQVIDLGKFNGNKVFTYDINNANTAVGYYFTDSAGFDDPIHGVAYQSGSYTDLGAITNPTANQSIIFGVNDLEQAVGFSIETVTKQDEDGNDETADYQRAVYTDIGSGVINVIPAFLPDDVQNMRALEINDNGMVVGFGRFNPEGDVDDNGNNSELFLDRGFIYDSINDVLTRLDPLNYNNEVLFASLRDINNNDRAVGWSQQAVELGRVAKGFYVDAADPTNLIQLPLSEEDRADWPWAINDSGKIVGKRNVDDAFLFTAYMYDTSTDTITDLGTLREGYVPQASFDQSVAFDINNNDQIVGTSLYDVVIDTYHAFIYEDGEMKDLNSLIDCKVDPTAPPVGEADWHLYEARGINDSGIIVGNGILTFTEDGDRKSERRSFMLVPRPGQDPVLCEAAPGTPGGDDDDGSGSLPLWGGLSLLAAAAWRRRKQ